MKLKDDSPSQRIRRLDVEDLIILSMIYKGKDYIYIKDTLNTTTTALSNRIRKYGTVWPGFSIKKSYRTLIPNSEAEKAIKAAAQSFAVLAR